MNTSTAARRKQPVSPAKAALAEHPFYTKLDENLQPLPRSAAKHAAVYDSRSQLIWDVGTHRAKNHADAVMLASKVPLGGGGDWRLPERNELITLTDLSRFDPCIDPEFFPDTPARFFWSNPAYAPNPAVCAWGVGFGSGFSDNSYRGIDRFVRAVRGPVARPGQ